MDWETVKAVFAREFATVLSSEQMVNVLNSAAHSTDGQRLVACVLIDVVAGALSIQTAARLMDVQQSVADLTQVVGNLIENAPDRDSLVCSSMLRGSDERRQYVRIMEMSSFITHYAGVGRHLTLNAEDVARVRHEYFGEPRARRLGDIAATWAGYNNIVWVMDAKDFVDIMSHDNDHASATELNDRLGLGHVFGAGERNRPELIAIEYPATFEGSFCVECRQPTTCDARWLAPNFYISYVKLDDWGRTFACSGSQEVLRERVHPMLTYLTNEFEIHYVGIADPPNEDRATLLDAAFERLATSISGPRGIA